MNKEGLIDQNYGNDFQNHLLEQYKLFVDSADKISSRRDSANNFYLTLNSVLFAISGYLSFLNEIKFAFIIIPLIGIIISYFWVKTIRSYRTLNTAKFRVIHMLENYLPAALYRYEWQLLEKGKKKVHIPMSVVEAGIPKVFMILYTIMIILMLFLNISAI